MEKRQGQLWRDGSGIGREGGCGKLALGLDMVGRHGCYVVVKGERVRLEVETWSPWHQVCGTGLGYLEIKGKLV